MDEEHATSFRRTEAVGPNSRAVVDLGGRLALRPREAALALGLSERKLREILPELPHVRVGGAVLLPVEGLCSWLRDRSRAEVSKVNATVEEVLQSMGR